MKNFNSLKVGVIFSLLLFLYTNGFAQNFILKDDLIDNRAKDKIVEIGNEVKTKTGVNIYVYSTSSFNLDKDISTKDKIDYIKNYELDILKIQEKFAYEYDNLRQSIVEKSLNQLRAKNREALTFNQKSAAKRLVEMYNYGLFEQNPIEYEID